MRRLERIVLCGAGAVGGLYASLLHARDPGCVSLLATGERLLRLRLQGLVVNGVRYDLPLRSPEESGAPADLVLVAVKQHHLAAAITALRPVVGRETIVLSLLNGISSEGLLGAAFGDSSVLPAFVLGTDSVRAGQQITYGQTGKIVFGARSRSDGPADPRVAAVADLFNRAGIPHSIPADILREQHWKFMLNVGVNQVSAVLRAPYGAFSTNPEVQALTRAAALEAVLVARAEGVALTPADVEQIFPVLARLAPGGKTSMLQDVEAGRKTEVELFAGTVLALGQKHQLPTPVNALLWQQLVALEQLAGVR